MAGPTNADILAAITALAARVEAVEARDAEAPASPSTAAASAHWRDRDLPCVATGHKGGKPCDKTFRTIRGQAFHTAANAK